MCCRLPGTSPGGRNAGRDTGRRPHAPSTWGDGITYTCPNCSRTANAGDRFCGGCGAPPRPTCVPCGRPHEGGHALFTYCGHSLTHQPPPPHEGPRPGRVLVLDMEVCTPYAPRSG